MIIISRGVFSKSLGWLRPEQFLLAHADRHPGDRRHRHLGAPQTGKVAMAHHLKNIWRLGVKELWSLWRDPVMLVLIVYTFTLSVYRGLGHARDAAPRADRHRRRGPVAAVRAHHVGVLPAAFHAPQMMNFAQVDPAMDAGRITFALTIPPGFQRDVLAGKTAELQLNVDATRMSQAFSGSGYVQQIVSGEINEFTQRHRAASSSPVDLEARALQPDAEQDLVRRGDADHQQRDHAVHHPHRRGAAPSASTAPSSICW